MHYERLSALDSSFLYLERPQQPTHVGSLMIFEGGMFFDDAGRFRIDDARRVLAGRLHLLPRFRMKLMEVPLGLGHPVWVDDPTFDLTYHVRVTALPQPGSDEQLRDLMGQLQGQPLDRRRPLWQLWFVQQLAGDRVAMIQKTHHALVDGISGVDVATVILDRQLPPADVHAPEWRPRPAPSEPQLLAASLAVRAINTASRLGAARQTRSAPRRVVPGAARLGRMARVAARLAPRSPLNVPTGPRRRFESVAIDLAQVKAVKRAFHCTTNDVVLASVAGALRHFLAERGEKVDHLTLRAMVPVSLRTRTERMALGNRLSALVTDVPVGIADPVDRLRAVKADMDQLKDSEQIDDIGRLLSAADRVPPQLIASIVQLVPLQRSANLVVANIPGPSHPLYCMGARMVEAYPYVGPIDRMALMVSTVRYNGRLFFGLCADAEALPDLSLLADALEKTVAELVRATLTCGQRAPLEQMMQGAPDAGLHRGQPGRLNPPSPPKIPA